MEKKDQKCTVSSAKRAGQSTKAVRIDWNDPIRRNLVYENELANKLGVSDQVIRAMSLKGYLSRYKVNGEKGILVRVTPDVEKFIQSRKEESKHKRIWAYTADENMQGAQNILTILDISKITGLPYTKMHRILKKVQIDVPKKSINCQLVGWLYNDRMKEYIEALKCMVSAMGDIGIKPELITGNMIESKLMEVKGNGNAKQ